MSSQQFKVRGVCFKSNYICLGLEKHLSIACRAHLESPVQKISFTCNFFFKENVLDFHVITPRSGRGGAAVSTRNNDGETGFGFPVGWAVVW